MHLRFSPRLVLFLAASMLGCLPGSLLARPGAPKLPIDLDLVPRDAAGFLHVHLADLWKHPAAADLRQMVGRVNPRLLKLFNDKTVPTPSTLNRVTIVFPTVQTLAEPTPSISPTAVSAVLVVSTSEAVERHRLVRSLAPDARTKTHAGRNYDLTEATWTALYIADDRHFVFGTEDAVQWFLERIGTGKEEGTLYPALREAANRQHLLTLGINGEPLNREVPAEALPPNLLALRQAEFGLLTLDIDKQVHIEARLQFADAQRSAAGLKAVRAGLDLAGAALQIPIAQGEQELQRSLENQASGPGKAGEQAFLLLGLGMLHEIEGRVKALPVQQDGSAIRLKQSVDLVQSWQGSALVCINAITMLGTNANATFTHVGAQIGGERDVGKAQLEPIAAALEKYHKEHGHFPPPAQLSKDGKPLLSWRVALLPYMGEEQLHKQFKLNESWDSPHNKKLLLRQPRAYLGRFPRKAWETCVLAFTGPDTVFAGPRGMQKQVITDGLPTTLLAVLAGEEASVSWTKPADIPFDLKRPLQQPWLGRGFAAIMADCSVRTIQAGTLETTIRGLITPRGGEKVFLPQP